ncbi:DNA polymerase-3 subunit epsilon [Mycolicibacterium sp. BK634]|uniref:3'-5' exonuclease n=1 Tax=Mycolicibacterium sp. BK634 TaxID=2587099 RepID=UPI00162079E1|nr:3'-5' exonuclease [Mycolicibacterium sp. BK634]MBB3752484.1 DNA polymerase-3 subunit epsilon [Mycolicibacterium sp. BK634]
MSRQTIVVDVETTGLEDHHVILEVAAVNIDTGEEMCFVPYVPMEDFAKASPEALAVNRYFERGIRQYMADEEETRLGYYKLRTWLEGNTLAGSNPSFDAGKLAKVKYTDPNGFSFEDGRTFGTPWHHRFRDLSAYAEGTLGLDELPGLHKVCELLGVENTAEHSALGDARATVECFRLLKGRPRKRVDIDKLCRKAQALGGMDTRSFSFAEAVFDLVNAIYQEAPAVHWVGRIKPENMIDGRDSWTRC